MSDVAPSNDPAAQRPPIPQDGGQPHPWPAQPPAQHGYTTGPPPGGYPQQSAPPGYPQVGAYGYPPQMRVAPKSPGISLLASFFIPGLGTMINGEVGKGIAFLLGYFAAAISMLVLVGFIATPAVWIWSMIDAYQGAQRWNMRYGILS